MHRNAGGNKMKRFIDRIQKSFSFRPVSEIVDESEKEYVEIGELGEPTKTQITVRPFVIDDFSDVKDILDALREGYTIGLVNIKPLKDKDIIQLKQVINKLKKTCDAIDGDIAGLGEDYIVVTPAFAKIYRAAGQRVSEPKVNEEKIE